MNVDRLIQMVVRLLFRQGAHALAKGQKTDPGKAAGTKWLRVGRRIGRF